MSTFIPQGGCSCNCVPCTCTCPPGDSGCMADMCAPRPCFFPGQLVTAEDLDAIVTYFHRRESLLAKLLAGWGVLGGMRLLSIGESLRVGDDGDGDGPPASIAPNPQVVLGSRIQVSAGAALDNAGHFLTQCSPRVIDIAALAKGPGVPQETHPLSYWLGSIFDGEDPIFTAAEYWVIAEYDEQPARPVPRLSGRPGPCDPEPNCDFSRRLEGVRVRLVKDLPFLYFLHGCLDPISIPGSEDYYNGVFNLRLLSELLAAVPPFEPDPPAPPPLPASASSAMAGVFSCAGYKLMPQLVEFGNQIAVTTCCSHPAVALGRVLLISDIGDSASAFSRPDSWYVLIDDAFPYRRVVTNSAASQTLLSVQLSQLACNFDTGGEVPA